MKSATKRILRAGKKEVFRFIYFLMAFLLAIPFPLPTIQIVQQTKPEHSLAFPESLNFPKIETKNAEAFADQAPQTVRPIIRGGGAENVLLIIDPNDETSKYLGNYYKNARGIPDQNVYYLKKPFSAAYPTFVTDNLQPVLDFMNDSKSYLRDHINYIVVAPSKSYAVNARYYDANNQVHYYANVGSSFSLSSAYTLAFLSSLILNNSPSMNPGGATPNHYCGHPMSTPPDPDMDAVDALISGNRPDVTLAFDSNHFWSVGRQDTDASYVNYYNANDPEMLPHQYLIGAVLGYTGTAGNSPEQIINMINRSVAAEGAHPGGTFYFMESPDIYRDRSPFFPEVIKRLQSLASQSPELSVHAEHLYGNSSLFLLPHMRDDVLGAMTGTAGPDFNHVRMTLLPGAFADHMTSFAGRLGYEGTMIGWLDEAASGTAGTVSEPGSFTPKFPHPDLHLLYYLGLSLGEAYLRSMQALPFQSLFVGDPLTRPFAYLPTVEVPDAPTGNVSGTIQLTPSGHTDKPRASIADYDLYVDGILRATIRANEVPFHLNTAPLADGHHAIRIVAYDDSSVRNQGRWMGTLKVNNRGKSISLNVAPLRIDRDHSFHVSAVAAGSSVQNIELLQNNRVLQTSTLFSPVFSVSGKTLGAGPSQLIARATFADGTQALSDPAAVNVSFDPIQNTSPVAEISTDVTQGELPLEVHFDASASNSFNGPISVYQWDFDSDGGVDAEGMNVTHTYRVRGRYAAKLMIEDEMGEKGTATTIISVHHNPDNEAPRVTVDFPATQVTMPVPRLSPYKTYPVSILITGNVSDDGKPLGASNLTTNWRAANSNGVIFGDATRPITTASIVGGGSNTLVFRLTAYDGELSTFADSNPITIREPIYFSAVPSSGPSPLNVQFTHHFRATDVSKITSYLWNFGDGATSTSPNPSHTYTQAGNYTVKLKEGGAGGIRIFTRNQLVQVDLGNQAPVANFIVKSSILSLGQTAYFTSTSTDPEGAVLTYEWNFGDGSTSTLQNPTHVYRNGGIFVVSLIVKDNGNPALSSAPYTALIVSDMAPSFSAQPESQNVDEGGSVTFSVAVSGSGPFNYQWMRNGSNIVDANEASYTLHNAQAAGIYTCKITNAIGSAISNAATLTINNPSCSHPNNLLTNSGFECGTQSWQGQNIESVSTFNPKDGNNILAITNIPAVDGNPAVPGIAFQNVPINPNMQYIPSGYYISNGAAPAQVGLYVIWLNGNNELRKDVVFEGAASSNWLSTIGPIAPLLIPASDADVARFQIEVTSGSAWFDALGLSLLVGVPSILNIQSQSQTKQVGDSVYFTVEGQNIVSAARYQWRRNGVNLYNGGNISGARTPILSIFKVFPSDDGAAFSVVVSNNTGSSVTSNSAILTVVSSSGGNTKPTADAQLVSTNEDTAKTITLTGSDAENSSLTYSVVSGVSHGSLSAINGNQITYTPSANYNGSDSFTFAASDGNLISNPATVTIDILSVNDQAVLTIGSPVVNNAVSVNENSVLDFAAAKDDPDPGQTFTFSATGLPQGAIFNTSSGAFSWTPTYSQAGTYPITFKVNDGVEDSDPVTVMITVNNVDRPAVLHPSPIADQSVEEGKTLTLDFTATDPDGDMVNVAATSTPSVVFIQLQDNGNGNWTLTASPPPGSAGTYEVTIQTGTTQETFTLNVSAAVASCTDSIQNGDETGIDCGGSCPNACIVPNHPPVFDAVPDQSVNENIELSFTVSATDEDNDPLTYSVDSSTLPANASFDPNTHTLTWTPDFTQAGSYSVTFQVTDHKDPPVEQAVPITVNPVNRPPLASFNPPDSIVSGTEAQFTSTSTDPDHDALSYFWDFGDGATSTEQNPTHTYAAAGDYTVTLTVSDGISPVTRQIQVSVSEPPGTCTDSIQNGDETGIDCGGSCPNACETQTCSNNLREGAEVCDGSDLAGQSCLTVPGGFTGGDLACHVTCDGFNTNACSINHPPEITSILRDGQQLTDDSVTIDENESLTFIVSASDQDSGQMVTVTASDLPSNASFDGAVFSWTPTYDQGRPEPYSITFTATDSFDPPASVSRVITITVNDVPQGEAPVITEQPNPLKVTKNEGESATFSIVATGTAPLNYQWKKNGNNLSNGENISGANTATLTVSNLATSDSGSYNVIVSNGMLPDAVSNSVVLTVTLAPSNLLENPSFELGNTDWVGIDGIAWAVISDETAHQGDNVLNLRGDYLGGLFEINQVVSVTADQIYQAGGWIRPRGAQYAHIYIDWLDASGAVLRNDTVGEVSGNTTWTHITKNITAPTNASQAKVRLRASIDIGVFGAVDYDDLEFFVGSSDPPPPVITSIYLDNQMAGFVDSNGDCLLAYDPETRTCGTGDQKAYNTFKDVVGVAGAGTTVYMRSGTYGTARTYFNKSGVPGAPITFTGCDGVICHDPRPRITGGPLHFTTTGSGNFILKNFEYSNGGYGFYISSALPRIHDMRIENCELHHFNESAIRAQGYGVERLVVQNCDVHHVGGTEGAFDIKVNKSDYSLGAGSRNLVFRNIRTHDNLHQASSGIIVQNSSENVIWINNRAWHNGEIGLCSKAGGYNIYINNIGWDQGKSAYYLRGPSKSFGDNVIIGGSNYILLNNLGFTRHAMTGDQGTVKIWDSSSAWLYNNTLVSLKSIGSFIGPVLSVSEPLNPGGVLYLKNNIIYRAFGDGWEIIMSAPGNRSFDGANNLFKNIKLRYAGDYVFPSSIKAEPLFLSLDLENDEVLHNVQVEPNSPAIDGGADYTDEDPEDYPSKVREFLSHYDESGDHTRAFEKFTILSVQEKQTLLKFLLEAHLHDRDWDPMTALDNEHLRTQKPDIGAYEMNYDLDKRPRFKNVLVGRAGMPETRKDCLAVSVQGTCYAPSLSEIEVNVADGNNDLDPSQVNLKSISGPEGLNVDLNMINQSKVILGNSTDGTLIFYSNIPDALQGEYVLVISAKDTAGNESEVTLKTYLDSEPPYAVIKDAKIVPSTRYAIYISVDATGSSDNTGIKKYEWDLNYDYQSFSPEIYKASHPFDGSSPTNAYYKYPGVSALSPDELNIVLRATDLAGNQTLAFPGPKLEVQPASLDFGSSIVTKAIRLKNIGGGSLYYSMSKEGNWIGLPGVTTGTLSQSQEAIIFISVNRSGLPPDSFAFAGTLVIQPNKDNASGEDLGSVSIPLVMNTSTAILPHAAQFAIQEDGFVRKEADQFIVQQGDPVTFVDQSTGEIKEWEWDFGDGTTLTYNYDDYDGTPRPDPITHVYQNVRIYEVKLKTINFLGAEASAPSAGIQVTKRPVKAAFTAAPTSGDYNLTVTFTDGSLGDITNWVWDFGDGQFESYQAKADSITHMYRSAGTFYVDLTVEGPDVVDPSKTDSNTSPRMAISVTPPEVPPEDPQDPVLNPIDDVYIASDTTRSIVITASDQNSWRVGNKIVDSLDFVEVSDPGSVISNITNYSGTSTGDQPPERSALVLVDAAGKVEGSYGVTIKVRDTMPRPDGVQGENEKSFNVIVTSKYKGLSRYTAVEGRPAYIVLGDPADGFAYSLKSHPPHSNFDPVKRELYWTPPQIADSQNLLYEASLDIDNETFKVKFEVLPADVYQNTSSLKTIYVDPSPLEEIDPNAPQGEAANPFPTIRSALAAAKAGTKVIIRPGIYEEDISPYHSGTPDQPVIFQAPYGGVEIYGKFKFYNVANIILDGHYLINGSPRNGITFAKGETSTISPLVALVNARNISLLHLNLENTAIRGDAPNNPAGSGSGVRIEHSNIYCTEGSALCNTSRVEMSLSNTHFYRDEVFRVAYGEILELNSLKNTNFYQCKFYENHGYISPGSGDIFFDASEFFNNAASGVYINNAALRIRISNSLFHDNSSAAVRSQNGGTIQFLNNTVTRNTSGVFSAHYGYPAKIELFNSILTDDPNSICRKDQKDCVLTQSNNMADSDSLFVNASDPDHLDFHLQEVVYNPAIDAGMDLSPLGVDFDKDGNPRPFGQNFDIGAYEWQPPPRPNTPPEFVNLVADQSVEEGRELQFAVEAQDADGDPLTLTSGDLPNGSVLEAQVKEGDVYKRIFKWTPGFDEVTAGSKVVQVTFSVRDGLSAPITRKVTMTVLHVNRPPTANQPLITPQNPVSTDALAAGYTYFDSDGDAEGGSEIRWYRNDEWQPAFNDLKEVPSSATAKKEEWYFTVRPNDGTSLGEEKSSAKVTIRNSPPVATSASYETREGVAKEITLSGSDADSDPLSFKISTRPKKGTLSGALPDVIYLPDADFSGTDSFGFKIEDDSEESEEAFITIRVLDGTPPVITVTHPTSDEMTNRERYLVLGTVEEKGSGLQSVTVQVNEEEPQIAEFSQNHFHLQVMLRDGSNTITVRAKDEAGNESTPVVIERVNLDQKPPVVKIHHPRANRVTRQETLLVVWSIDDEMQHEQVALRPGKNVIRKNAEDLVRNAGSDFITVYRLEGRRIGLVRPQPGEVVTQSPVSIEYRLDGRDEIHRVTKELTRGINLIEIKADAIMEEGYNNRADAVGAGDNAPLPPNPQAARRQASAPESFPLVTEAPETIPEETYVLPVIYDPAPSSTPPPTDPGDEEPSDDTGTPAETSITPLGGAWVIGAGDSKPEETAEEDATQESQSQLATRKARGETNWSAGAISFPPPQERVDWQPAQVDSERIEAFVYLSRGPSAFPMTPVDLGANLASSFNPSGRLNQSALSPPALLDSVKSKLEQMPAAPYATQVNRSALLKSQPQKENWIKVWIEKLLRWLNFMA